MRFMGFVLGKGNDFSAFGYMYDRFNLMYDCSSPPSRSRLYLSIDLKFKTMQNRLTPPHASGDRYAAPAVTIAEVAVERGFAASADYDDLTLPEFGVVDEDQW